MAQAVNNGSGFQLKPFTPEDDANLREALKRCSAATYEAAAQFRKTGNTEHLPAIVLGIIERYVEPDLRAKLDPAALGLFFTPARNRALAASRESMDFGQLFIGFSFFLIVAALLLTAMREVVYGLSAHCGSGGFF